VNGPVWFGAYLAAVGLLAAGGAAKAARPSGTARALSQLGLPIGEWAIRAGAVGEIAVGGWVVLWGGAAPAVCAAASYLGFAGFVTVALARRTPLRSCGCFGEEDVPPTVTHALLNAGAAAVAIAAAVGYHPSLAVAVRSQPAGGLPFVLLTATATYLGYLAMVVLPRTGAAAKVIR
jgi:hypothetical protein